MAAPAATDRLAAMGAAIAFAVVTLLYLGAVVLTVLAGLPLWPDPAIQLGLYGFAAVGALVAVRRPRNTIAWLCLAIGLVWSLSAALEAALAYERFNPGLLPRPDIALAFTELWLPALFLMGTFALLFPDGRLPSRRWRPVPWVAAASLVLLYLGFVLQPRSFPEYGFPHLVNPLGVEALRPLIGVRSIVLLLPAYVLISAVALLLRFRRASGVERLQLKWVVACGGLVAPVYLGALVTMLTLELRHGDTALVEDLLGQLAALLFGIFPVAIGVALLRYRLYEIDRLVSRTVTYALVVGMLVAVYVGGVILLRSVFPLQGGLAVAASTLAVAALFNPLRRRVQHRVDRRFNRARYDAEQVVERFAARLRDELDLDELTSDLLAVVAATVQPATANVWIRGDDG